MTATLPYRWYTDPEVLAARARAAVRAGVALRRAPRARRRAGLLLHLPRRRRAGRRRARSRRRAARVRQRLPPPRRRGRVGRRAAARRCSATTTPGPTGSTARCARRRAPRDGPRPRRARPAPGARSTRGARSSSSTPRRTPPPLADTLGAAARRRGRAAGSTSTRSSSTTARDYAPAGQLEGARRELPRVLPLRRRPPGPRRRHRRPPGRLPAASATRPSPATTRTCARARATRATTRPGRRPVPPRLAGAEGQRHARAAEPVDRPAVAGRPRARTDGVLDYFFAPDEDPGVDRRLHRARRRGRRRGPRARRVRPARDGRGRARARRAAAPQRGPDRRLPGWVGRRRFTSRGNASVQEREQTRSSPS